jgi:hypothetical protein
VAIAFSILRATSVSICDGAAPGRLAVTVTVGSSMSGNCWIVIALNDIRPTTVSMMNSITDGIGFLIDQVEKFMTVSGRRSLRHHFLAVCAGASTTRTTSPAFRKPVPVATTGVDGARPRTISTRSPLRRPVSTLTSSTRLSLPTR